MRIAVVIACVIMSMAAQAQKPVWHSEEVDWAVIANGAASFDANSLSNNLLNTLYYGGYIDQAMKDHILNRSKSTNRLGLEAGYGIELYHLKGFKLKEKNISWKLSASESYFANASYATDLFELVFYGNKGFLGETANLAPLNVKFMKLHQAGLSYVFSENMHEVGLSIVNSASALSAKASEATLFTADETFTLDLAARGHVIDATTSNYFDSKGLGLALNFRLNDIINVGEKTTVSLSGENLGWSSWKSDKLYRMDTTFQFDGIDIANLLDYSPPDTISLLDSLTKPVTDTAYKALLPGDIRLTFRTQINDKLFLDAGVRYLLNANFFPQFRAMAWYNFTEQYAASMAVTYGGYGNLRIGLGAQALWKDNLYLKIMAPNVVGFVSGKSVGMGLQVQLAKFF